MSHDYVCNHVLTVVIICEIRLEMKKEMSCPPRAYNLVEKSGYTQMQSQDKASLSYLPVALASSLHFLL